jgi:hypothetical protein
MTKDDSLVYFRGTTIVCGGLSPQTPPILTHMRIFESEWILDAKTGLLTGLLTGIQGWKCPVALSQTCYGSKSLKVILMDSNFGGHPVLNPPVTL